MLNYKVNAQRGFTPAAVAPRCDNSQSSATSSSLSAGAAWGTGTVPSFIRTSILNFISREKEFSRAGFLKKASVLSNVEQWTQKCQSKKPGNFSGKTCHQHYFIRNHVSENKPQPCDGDDSAFLPHGARVYQDRFPGSDRNIFLSEMLQFRH